MTLIRKRLLLDRFLNSTHIKPLGEKNLGVARTLFEPQNIPRRKDRQLIFSQVHP